MNNFIIRHHLQTMHVDRTVKKGRGLKISKKCPFYSTTTCLLSDRLLCERGESKKMVHTVYGSDHPIKIAQMKNLLNTNCCKHHHASFDVIK